MPRGETHPGIKAINKIIALVILFQSCGLLVHPAAAMVNFLMVTVVACCSPAGAPRKALRTCTSAGRLFIRLVGWEHSSRHGGPEVVIKGCYWAVRYQSRWLRVTWTLIWFCHCVRSSGAEMTLHRLGGGLEG